MALVACPECKTEMSSDALACPRCGKPNKKVASKEANKNQDGAQKTGCLLMVVAIPLLFLFPLAGVVLLLVGLVLAAANTRVW